MDVLIDGLKVALLGISVTFAMLFIIVGFVKLLKPALDMFLRMSERLKNRSKAVNSKENTDIVAEVPKPIEEIKSDDAVIAAIVAAICYESGMSSDMFVLKSIRRKRSTGFIKR